MEDIARVADKIIVMNKSNLVMFDKTKEVFSKGRELEKIGLRVPQITKIMLELREKGFNVPEGILTVDEAMDCISSLLDKEGKIITRNPTSIISFARGSHLWITLFEGKY